MARRRFSRGVRRRSVRSGGYGYRRGSSYRRRGRKRSGKRLGSYTVSRGGIRL